ncbi:carbohydrate binding domain-containing protein [Sphingomonas sp.]|uniref:carbohydrate binding domain-containing protein n=1 Tax=Sphingomonas sp. TaxID=28214 RepID=UPI00286CB4FB|nr:carbohydrate binding domain-containing protein [Sphingomonas sp.]
MRRLAVLLVLVVLSAAPAPILVDPMDDAAAWPAKGSDSVAASSAANNGAVELRYDFGEVSGYGYMRRAVDVALPGNYEIRFKIKGMGGRNDLQLKLTDGDNVWWKVWRNFRPPEQWQQVVVPAGEIVFAWGPAEDKTLSHADGIEFVIARNRDGGAGRISVDDLQIIPLPGIPAVARQETSADDAIAALAKASPRGGYPRAFIGEQPYWTLAGSDGGKVAALISEDAAIEPAKGSFSIEPLVVDGGKRYDWATVEESHSLADGRLPIPTVTWIAPGFRLDTTLLADSAGRAVLAGYQLTNIAGRRREIEVRLGIRPWQVNPPAQFLAQQGGASPIARIVRDGAGLAITQPQTEGDPPVTRVVLASRPTTAMTIGTLPGQDMATADLVYRLDLAPGASERIVLTMHSANAAAPSWDSALAATKAHWRDMLGRVKLRVPPAKRAVADTLATAFSHILTSRDGPMLKPGTRSYDRAWIRDGAMMSEALLRMGRADVARSFADWYRPNQFKSGKIPCCVDFRGADPVPENDSHGEYIFLIGELYRFTGDRAALNRDWPSVLAATRYMDQLRLSEQTPANLSPDRRMLYGLMPPSISHEGYSAKAQYSLWDDFWALRGYRDAADIAQTLGKPEAANIAASRDQFATDLHAAILVARDHWKIAFIPGATSLGDFDATSTTIALDPGNEQARLDPKMLAATFERYWREFQTRAAGSREWKDYTPYETRTIGSFVRLGWHDRIDPLLAFFMADRRPAAWNQWAEVVGRDQREIRFIGDMPHAWVASDFVRGVLDMFAWERRDERALVLGGGLSAAWLTGDGSSIVGLATAYGRLDFAMRGNGNRLVATINGAAHPPGGFVLAWPFESNPRPARIDGRAVPWRNKMLTFNATGKPIRIEVGR